MQNNEIMDRYNALFPVDMSMQDISKKLDEMNNDKDIDKLRQIFCNGLVYFITSGYIEYPKKREFLKDTCVQVLLKNIEKLPKEYIFYWMMHGLYSENEKEFLEYFNKDIEYIKENAVEPLSEGDLLDMYIEPLKEAFPGLWMYAQNKLEAFCKKDGTHELCMLMATIYERETDDEAEDALTQFIQKYPNITIAKEYLALIYMNLKRWNNAIAYFESVETPMLFINSMDRYYFLLAISYGNIKNYTEEEKAYRECMEINPDYQYVKNNLGYCLYKQKRYIEAKMLFEECLEQEIDLPYSANNLVRVLIALGRNSDAKKIVNEKKYRINKSLKDKVKKLSNTNKRLQKATLNTSIVDEIAEESIANKKSVLAVRGSQFSTEKILEDELTARIESGVDVFGKKLKIYKRKGQYGRQFIIPVGRLDLLCEDERGNLYVIELKKDSGYDDVYKQISDYLDWFEKDKISEGKNVYGIICLNNPTKELLDRVHADNRVHIFEYQISYTER